jgi:hypothetical protein
VTSCPCWRKQIAVLRPPIPAPQISTLRGFTAASSKIETVTPFTPFVAAIVDCELLEDTEYDRSKLEFCRKCKTFYLSCAHVEHQSYIPPRSNSLTGIIVLSPCEHAHGGVDFRELVDLTPHLDRFVSTSRVPESRATGRLTDTT